MSDRKLTDGNDGQTIVPDGADGGYLPVSQYDIDTFNDILSDEIDSDFSSSICCCDKCYDDFAKRWPGVDQHNLEFLANCVGVEDCIEQSRLVQLYTQAELKTLKRLVTCPRCGEYARRSIHIFEHPFDRVHEIEDEIDEVTALGSETPFLLLEHPFARSVLESVRHLSQNTLPRRMNKSYFRARKSADISKCGQALSDLATFGPAPAGVIGEGRFNHAGSTMVYLATSMETALLEIGTLNEAFSVAELSVDGEFKILDLVELDDGHDASMPLLAMANSVLVAAPRKDRGWLRPEYVFSRFVADCAKNAGFDVIRYASTKRGGGENYVLLSPGSDPATYLRLLQVHAR